jgi:hypothetical protein
MAAGKTHVATSVDDNDATLNEARPDESPRLIFPAVVSNDRCRNNVHSVFLGAKIAGNDVVLVDCILEDR